MGAKGEYPRFLAIAYVISAGNVPFFFSLGLPSVLAMFAVSGFVFGTTFYFLALISKRIRMRSFLIQILVRTLLAAFNLIVSMSVVTVVAAAMFSHVPVNNPQLYRQLLAWVDPRLTLGAVLLGLFLTFIVNSIVAVSQKLGPGVLWNWLTGKYYSPREEELVVMFLDMKDSTTIAESLGTLRFSALVKDLFADLTGPLQSTGARVSHYIGDEAVIYWYPVAAFRNEACLKLVPLFRAVLAERAPYYQSRYGLVPDFKAGAHVGPVVSTEVGEIKSEIVLHGDTLNTAARIQGLCGSEGQMFLISGELASRVPVEGLVALGQREVKGREQGVDLFAVPIPGSPIGTPGT